MSLLIKSIGFLKHYYGSIDAEDCVLAVCNSTPLALFLTLISI